MRPPTELRSLVGVAGSQGLCLLSACTQELRRLSGSMALLGKAGTCMCDRKVACALRPVPAALL